MSDTNTFGSGLGTGGEGATTSGIDAPQLDSALAMPAPQQSASPSSFGSGLGTMLGGPQYAPPDPKTSALDQTADTLQQRIQRANTIATNPMLQLFSPEGVQAARNFVPAATEQLQKIKAQKADMQANRQQAATLGLDPGEVPDEASMADRVEIAKAKALSGDLKVFRGLQAVDPKSAEAIQDQVHEAVAGHLTKAQLAFDSLSAMQNQGQYSAKLNALRKDGTITDLETLGLKVPDSQDVFNASKAKEGRALREARIGVDTIRQKLEERNTYQPMEEKEAKTYDGRLTTAFGDQVTNGTWARNGAAGTRGLIVNGAADPRGLGKDFTLATPEQRKAIKEEFDGAVPKEDVEKYRAFNRTYQMATTDAKGNKMADGTINTNPNVQQGVAEGLASMLRGGSGGANVGLLKIELAKRGWAQGAIDGLVGNYAGALNTMFSNAGKPYLTQATQKQIRDVMDVLKTYNDSNVGDRVSQIAQRAGALGLDPASLGFGKGESAGGIGDALEAGRQAQIARMMPHHQAIGGGDGVLQLGAQRPGNDATGMPAGSTPTTQLPGAAPLTTPVQQATRPVSPSPGSPGGSPPPVASQPAMPGTSGGGSPPAPMTIAGQPVSVPTPPGVSPNFVPALQRIETGRSKDPWTATAGNGPDGKPLSSASGAFQMIDKTWNDNKPAGAPNRAKDATPAQQSEAFATLIGKNAATLQTAGIPVNDTSLYVAHNLGATGASTLLKSDPNADARTVVGETAARNNPMFFRGKPTVAMVLQRYKAEMDKTPEPDGPKPLPGSGGATAEAPGLMARIGRVLSQGIPGSGADKDAAAAKVGAAATENAPAIGSTLGAVGGSALGPAGTVAGGAAGGGAGQALKDYLQGNEQNPTEIAKQTALGGVLGVGGAARPVVSAVVRAGGAGAVEAGAAAAEGKDASDIVDAGVKGVASAAGGEAFGRALGMAGHKLWNLFAPGAKQAVQEAAKTYHETSKVLETETPKLPGVAGAAGSPNPKYEAAEAAKAKAETTLKDAGFNPDEAAYAHKVSAEGVPLQEAQAGKPGALEQKNIGAGYQQLENEIGDKGVGAVKATPRQPAADNALQKIDEGSMRDGRQTVTYMAKTDSGNVVASFALNGKEAELRHIGMQGAGENEAANTVGASTVRSLLKDFQQLHPEVETVKANRFSGARTGGVYGGQGKDISIKLPNGSMSAPHLQDGPMAAVASKQVSAQHAELAERTEMAITAPAANWREKWNQLKDARSALLGAERDALTSTEAGRTQTAKDMRTLADTVRVQQAKAANYVFGPQDGPAFVARLKVLDTRYRNLMEATNGGDIAGAARMTGEAGRDADRKFRAFAHDDPTAIAAWTAMRKGGSNVEKDVRTLVGVEKIPYVGKAVSYAKMAGAFREWMRDRTAGSPATFAEMLKQPHNDEANQAVRDLLGSAGARGATMQ